MNFTQEHLAGRVDFQAFYESEGVVFKGRRGICPFYKDTNPSFDVDRGTGCYICRAGCGGGDPVTFLQKHRGFDSASAIAELRRRYGIPDKNRNGNSNEHGVPPSTPSPSTQPDAESFWSGLALDDAEGVAYLEGRGLWPVPEGTVRFAPGDTHRIAVALYDAENRLVNVQRRPAVSRDKMKPPPFLPIKGAPVAGTSFGRLDRYGGVWLVEGLTDYLAATILAKKRIPLGVPGVGNAVALIEARADQFKDRTVFVSLDNDEAGKKATAEACSALLEAGARPVIARYPEGFKDLAELVEKRGIDGAREVMVEVCKEALEKSAETAPEPTGDARPWFVVGANEFCSMTFPEREYLLEPWFQEKNLALLYAPRGVGKTIASTGIALAVSCGGQFLRWKAPRPRRVLYIDGELPQETLQKRLRDVAAASGLSLTENLRLLTPDLQPAGVRLPNLADREVQEAVEALVDAENPDLIVLDNLSTLCRGGEENAAESWQIIQDWLILLRSRRRSVLLDHHSGKSGDQRGTSKREDVLDVSIRLARPGDYQPEQGARFEVHFEKSRDPHGDAVAPFEAWLQGDSWTIKALTAALEEKMIRLAKEGLTTRQIAKDVGRHHSSVARVLKKAEQDGRLVPSEGDQ